MSSTATRAILAAGAVAPIAYVMFSAMDPTERVAVSAILAVTAGVFAALFFGPSSKQTPQD